MITPIIQLVVTFLNLLLGIFVLRKDLKSLNNQLYSLMSFVAAAWTFSNYLLTITLSLIWLQISYALGVLVISLGLIWTLFITENILKRKIVLPVILTALIINICSFLPGFIINSFEINTKGNIIKGNPGWGLILYTLYYFFVAFFILIKLYGAWKKTRSTETGSQFKSIYCGALITLTVTAFSSFVLPFFSIFTFPIESVDNIGFLIFLIFIAYAITKHHLFNIRVITVELITVILWMTILTRVLVAQNTNELLIELGVLLLTIIFGVILIRSTLQEVRQREKIELLARELKDLNENLEAKVAEQTEDVRKALELEKKAHKDLERLNETKDQFIMITQHHLRTPVTTVTWSLEAILKGDYGGIAPELRKILETTKSAARRLTRIVDDFLSITAINIGTEILKIAGASLKPILDDVLLELELEIKNRNITIDYPIDESQWPTIPIDAQKVREVLLIILENAVRYNFQDGTIRIIPTVDTDEFKVVIENTGIGIEHADKEKLFTSLFHRGKDAREAHALGMGVGLSVSRAIIRTHQGNIHIESEGKNKGARVTLVLPMRRS